MTSVKFIGFTLPQLEDEEKREEKISEVDLQQLTKLEQKLLFKYTKTMCPTGTKVDLSKLKADELKTKIIKKFTEPAVMKAAMCVTEHILSGNSSKIYLDNNAGMELSCSYLEKYIQNLQIIGSGGFGTAMTADLVIPLSKSNSLEVVSSENKTQISRNIFIIKKIDEEEDYFIYTLIHEASIAILSINQLRMYNIPNFAMVYGLFFCPNEIPLEDEEKEEERILTSKTSLRGCSNKGEIPAILYENIVGISMREFTLNCTSRDFVSIFLQLLHALEFAYDYCGFVHGDLTPRNIILRQTSSSIASIQSEIGCWIKYAAPLNKTDHKERWIYSTTGLIPTLIDYGFSQVFLKNEKESIRLSTVKMKQTPFHDIVEFLTSSILDMTSGENSTRISDILPLIQFFFPKITSSDYYNYNKIGKYMPEIKDNTVSQYIDFVIQTMHAEDMITNNQPTGRIINVNDTGLTVEKILQEINVI